MGFSTFPAVSAASKWERTVTFTSTQSWIVPTDVTQVEAILVAGGGGGGGGGYTGTACGGAGSVKHLQGINVTPSSSVTVTIGAGGTGGLYNDSANLGRGTAGGTTSFGGTSVPGGNAGRAISNQQSYLLSMGQFLGSHGGRISTYESSSLNNAIPSDGLGYMGYGAGGAGGTNNVNFQASPGLGYNGAGRGGYPDGAGGAAAANTGAGGGGAGNAATAWESCNGGSGGSGIAIIKYWSAL